MELKSNTLLQPKSKSFFDFNSALTKITSSRLDKVDNTDNAMAMSASDLSISNTM